MFHSLFHIAFGFLSNHKLSVTAAVGLIIALCGATSVRRYWIEFIRHFWSECWRTWKRELFSSLALAVIVFIAQALNNEVEAEKSFYTSLSAAAILLVGWASFHALRVPALIQADSEKQKEQTIGELEEANKTIASREAELSATNIRFGQCHVGFNLEAVYICQLRKYDGLKQTGHRLADGRQQFAMKPSYIQIPDHSHVVVDLWLFNNGGLPTTVWDFRLSMKIDNQTFVGQFIPEVEGCYVNKELLPGQIRTLAKYSQRSVDMEITAANPLTRSGPRRCWVHFAFPKLQPSLYRAVVCDLEFRDATEKRKYFIQADFLPTEIHQDE